MFQRRQAADAQDALRRAYAASPDLEILPDFYSPEFVKAAAEVKAALRPTPAAPAADLAELKRVAREKLADGAAEDVIHDLTYDVPRDKLRRRVPRPSRGGVREAREIQRGLAHPGGEGRSVEGSSPLRRTVRPRRAPRHPRRRLLPLPRPGRGRFPPGPRRALPPSTTSASAGRPSRTATR